MATYNITTGNDDYYSVQFDGGGLTYHYTTATLYNGRNQTIFPASTEIAYIKINTAAIPDTDVISAATLYIYEHSYTSSKGTSKIYRIYMPSATSFVVLDKTYAGGWTSEALNATEIAAIDKTGLTRFTISTADPGATKFRTFQIRAYEYDTPSTFSAYLVVTHAAPSTGVITRTLLGAGI
jgi:hypothetical protein